MNVRRFVSRIIMASMAAGLALPLFGPAAPAVAGILRADPTADEIIAAAVAAIGGQEKIDAIKTLHSEMVLNMGMEVKMETKWAREGGRLVIVSFGPETMTMGTDGKVMWTTSPEGTMLMPEMQKSDFEDQATIMIKFIDVRNSLMAEMEKIENAGKATFAGKECWKLHYKDKEGAEGDLFFDAATSLPAGFEETTKEGDAESRSQGIMSDWKEIDGIKVFHAIAMTSSDMPGVTMAIAVVKCEFNTLDAAVFALPEEVKKLAAEQPAAEKPALDAPATDKPLTDAPAAAGGAEIKFEDMTPAQQKTAKEALDGFKASGDVNTMKQMVQRVEPVIGMMPPDEQLPIKYALQELKKEIAKLGG